MKDSSNKDIVRHPTQFRGERQPQPLKRLFVLRASPPIFTSIGQGL